MRLSVLLLLLLALWVCLGQVLTATASATPPPVSFAPAVEYTMPTGDVAVRVALAPLRGGQLDDIVTGDTNGNITVFLNNGDGTFAAGVDYATNGQSITGLAIADVNGDGHPDVVATTNTVSTTAAIYFSR